MASRVVWKGEQALKAAKVAACAAIAAGAIFIQAETKKNLNRHNSGSPAKPSKPSSPGRPPGKQSGALSRSIQVDLSDCKNKLIARVGTNLIYARIQEFGGMITAKTAKFLKFMLPDGTWRMVKSVFLPSRPYMRPVIARKQRKILDTVAVTFRKVFFKQTRNLR